MTSTGDLHIFFNGHHGDRIATRLPKHKQIWGVVDVGGDCIVIKSEMLYGKFYGVNVNERVLV